jgi:hypothetical protein
MFPVLSAKAGSLETKTLPSPTCKQFCSFGWRVGRAWEKKKVPGENSLWSYLL